MDLFGRKASTNSITPSIKYMPIISTNQLLSIRKMAVPQLKLNASSSTCKRGNLRLSASSTKYHNMTPLLKDSKNARCTGASFSVNKKEIKRNLLLELERASIFYKKKSTRLFTSNRESHKLYRGRSYRNKKEDITLNQPTKSASSSALVSGILSYLDSHRIVFNGRATPSLI